MILPDAGNGEVTYYAGSAVLLAAYPTVKLVEAVCRRATGQTVDVS